MAGQITYTDGAGTEHALPKLTVAIADRLSAVADADAPRKRWAAELDAVRAVLGRDEAAALLDGSTLEKVDLSALDAEFEGIRDAYQRPSREARMRASAASIAQLDELDLDRIVRVAEAVESIGRNVDRSAFRGVR